MRAVAAKPRHAHHFLAWILVLLLIQGFAMAFAWAYDSRYGGWWWSAIVCATVVGLANALLILHWVWEHGHDHAIHAADSQHKAAP